MMTQSREWLTGIPILLAVVEARSFTGAAKKLGITPSAASQAVRALEGRLGTALLLRSTRSLSLTAIGTTYVERLAPVFVELVAATEEAMGNGEHPAGPLRLTMPKAAYDGIVAPSLPSFRAHYPDIELEIEVEDRWVDIVKDGFDAGIRYGNLLAKGMTAIEIAPASASVLAAAPAYLERRGRPEAPPDLAEHESVVCRSRTTGMIASWALVSEAGAEHRVDPGAQTIAGDLAVQIDLTVRGHGISCIPDRSASALLDGGQLERVLPDWSIPLDAMFLYFAGNRSHSPSLQAFIRHATGAGQGRSRARRIR
ncbi:LysR family transcriptional regulator [Pendulispora albinea]|uniref:LysR family transcriptional regulator n=1 Tax=Pendulispora albinea TaxID=2741071 RepID=A0ABZ2MAM7_9BACT